LSEDFNSKSDWRGNYFKFDLSESASIFSLLKIFYSNYSGKGNLTIAFYARF